MLLCNNSQTSNIGAQAHSGCSDAAKSGWHILHVTFFVFSVMRSSNKTILPAVDHRSKNVRKAGGTEAHQKDQQCKKSRVRGKAGKLAGLLELPLDVLLEVRFGFNLHPNITPLVHVQSIDIWTFNAT